ncbi:MAG: hypothetical protein KC609_19900 [Myxococcales bacterium]|nr:hypothetical protein [Myxococcales bacterium]
MILFALLISHSAFAQECASDEDCGSGDICDSGVCVAATDPVDDPGDPNDPGNETDNTFTDTDGDGIDDEFDPNVGSNDAIDTDGDGIYDAFDPEPTVFGDEDNDGVGDGFEDTNGDGTPDFQQQISDSGGTYDVPGVDDNSVFVHKNGGLDGDPTTACNMSQSAPTGAALIFFAMLMLAFVGLRRMREQ